MVLPTEVIICGLYWFLLNSGDTSYLNTMLHGAGIVLLIIDGFILNRIPIRMKQFLLFEALALGYVFWSLIFTYSDLTNPYQEAGYQDDDAIYPTLRWKTNTGEVAVLVAILLFVVDPVVFLLCRWVSRLLPKRLVNVEMKSNSGDIELGETLGETSG